MKINYSLAPIKGAIIFISILILPSCVAKKKFVAMEESRNRADKRVRELTKNIEGLESDFNEYKNEFHYNNSMKDNMIDSLNRTIVNLNSDILSKSDNIEDQVFSFQVEKKRLNQLLVEKDKEIRALNSELSSLKVQLGDLEKSSNDVQIQYRNSLNEINTLNSRIIQIENEKSKLETGLAKSNAELTKLKSSINEKNEEIEVLKNQIKVYKSAK